MSQLVRCVVRDETIDSMTKPPRTRQTRFHELEKASKGVTSRLVDVKLIDILERPSNELALPNGKWLEVLLK